MVQAADAGRRRQAAAVAAFLPARSEVTEDYWGYARWRAMHRLFSSMLQNFATQARRRARPRGAPLSAHRHFHRSPTAPGGKSSATAACT